MLLIGKSQSGRGEVSSPQSLPRVVVVVQLLFGGGEGVQVQGLSGEVFQTSVSAFPEAVRPRIPKKHTVQFWAQESSDTGRCQWLSGVMSSVLPGPLGAACLCPHTDLVAETSVWS